MPHPLMECALVLRRQQSTRKFLQDDKCYLDSGKVSALLRLLEEYFAQKRKILIFSQVGRSVFSTHILNT